MTEHTVKAYDQELQELTQLVAEMGGRAEKQIGDAMNALSRHDTDLAARVVAADVSIDDLQRRIEGMVIHLIGKRQPMAGDLRDIVGALRISIDLERIGDFAKNIAKRVAALTGLSYSAHLLLRLEQMADLCLAQIKDVLDSYGAQDADKAVAVWDGLYTALFRELLTYMAEEPRNITFSTHLLFCAKNIERMGDHVTNVAETIYYMVTGTPLTDERPKGDASTATPTPA